MFNQSYFYIALGHAYIDMCVLLVQTLRKQGDARPICLLIHPQDEPYARSKNLFDAFVHFTPSGSIWDDCKTSFEKFCLYPRLYLDAYINQLPYDEFIITDTDVLCQYTTEHMWSYLSRQSHNVRMLGNYNDPTWHWGTINQVSQAYKKHVPSTHGGFFYLRKSPALSQFFDYAKDVFWNYDNYKCKRWFRDGRVDEIIFAITHAHFDMRPLEFDEFPVMTFNYTPDIAIPSNIQTEGDRHRPMRDCIPFVHMFDKIDGVNFQALYKAIMG